MCDEIKTVSPEVKQQIAKSGILQQIAKLILDEMNRREKEKRRKIKSIN